MYFSEREKGEIPRDIEKVGEGPWGGIQSLIQTGIEGGGFGATYPYQCPDGDGPVGTDEANFWRAMRAEIPDLPEHPWRVSLNSIQSDSDIFDMVEFCWRCIGKPIQYDYHQYFKHHHLRFEIDEGRQEFAESINRIFRRNGLAYNLTDEGQVVRLPPVILRESLASIHFQAPDADLNRMLEKACHKFLNPDEAVRQEALEALWDGWERLKTLGDGKGKKAQVNNLLDNVAGSSSSEFRGILSEDAKNLTRIGNSLQIRHSETAQERLANSQHVDYVFHRLFALIRMVLQTKGWC